MSVLFYDFFIVLFSVLFVLAVGGGVWLMMLGSTVLIDWSVSDYGGGSVVFSLIFDGWCLVLSGVVLLISLNVLNFAKTYMVDEEFNGRFLGLVVLFVLSMNLLVFIPNLVVMLLGWDGLGLISYLLVIYYSNPSSLAAGMLTVLSNRVGDGLILASIGLLVGGNNLMMLNVWGDDLVMVMVLISFAAFTKSAQFPFCSWLPAAMAAPTPVSALVHSSTLVTAGVFLLIRMDDFLVGIPGYRFVLVLISGVTMLLSGMAAIFETDMKKIIALSTLSQLGVMMGSIGIGAVDFALFHLMTHAMFKALMFMGAGMIIHFSVHWQDLRVVGMVNSASMMPLVSASLLVSNFALCGMPFMAGFYSKDKVLEFSMAGSGNLIVAGVFMFATVLTSAYSMRFLFNMGWLGNYRFGSLMSGDEDFMISGKALCVLGFSSIVGGAMLNWLMLSGLDEFPLLWWTKLMPLFVVGCGVVLFFWEVNYYFGFSLGLMYCASMWFLVPLSTQGLLSSMSYMGKLGSVVDQGWQEVLGGEGVKALSIDIFSRLSSVQNWSFMMHLTLGVMVSTPVLLF